MTRAPIAIVAAGFLLAAAGNSHAIVTDWTIDHSPVLLGESVTFQAVFGPPHNVGIVSYKWEVQGVYQNGTPADWVDLQVNMFYTSRFMSQVGQLNVKLTVKYAPSMDWTQHPDTVITHVVNVLPPDKDVVVQGLNTPTLLDFDQTATNRLTVKFEMRRGSSPVGTMIAGYVQELVYNYEDLNPETGEFEPYSGSGQWVPAAGVTSGTFYKEGNKIIDKKATSKARYDLLDLDDVFALYIQVNRLVTMNWVGEEVIIMFPGHSFLKKKASNTEWKLEEY